MGDVDVVLPPLGMGLAGGLAAVSGIGGGVDAAGGAVLTGEGGGGGEQAASSAPPANGAISIKRRRVAGDTIMMSLADKKVMKITLLKTLQTNGLQQEMIRYQHLQLANLSADVV